MPKLSNTTKMQITGKKVKSWSLQAGTSCPGSAGAEVCDGCYALKGMYRFPVVKDARSYNQSDYKKDDWTFRMISKVNKLDYFRWFDSGDVETRELADKIHTVIQGTPSVQHWLPTRSDKIAKISSGIKNIELLPNVAVRRSADNIGLTKPERLGVNSYVIKPDDIANAKLLGITVCPVTLPGSTQKSCDLCTLCYTSSSVAYLLH